MLATSFESKQKAFTDYQQSTLNSAYCSFNISSTMDQSSSVSDGGQQEQEQQLILAQLYAQQQLAAQQQDQQQQQSSGLLYDSAGGGGGGMGIDGHYDAQQQHSPNSSSGGANWSAETGSNLIINYLPQGMTQEEVIHFEDGGGALVVCRMCE